MKAALRSIEYYLPDTVLTSEDLARDFPHWPVSKIEEKTGIRERHIAAEDECSSDLGVKAALKLFASGACEPEDVDYLLFCTQTPDYLLPTTACLIQERLGLRRSIGALDFNLGCSGFIYGLSLAQGLIETGQASRVLLITAETYSKLLHPEDRSVRTIFGDGAAATLIEAVDSPEPRIGPFVFGTDGRGACSLIVPAGGMRRPRSADTAIAFEKEGGSRRSEESLHLDGPKVFEFTLRVVPHCVSALLEKAGKRMEDIDQAVFHQANRFMLDHLRVKLNIPVDRFVFALADCGNTVSASIPIALKKALCTGQLTPGSLAMLVGFGVGLSWGATFVRL